MQGAGTRFATWTQTLCAILDGERPRGDGKSYRDSITFVKNRPGHNRRYAIDRTKMQRELGWKPSQTFEYGVRRTVGWYLEKPQWVDDERRLFGVDT